MSGNRNILYDREAGTHRLLDMISLLKDQHIEQALDTDTQAQYEALASENTQRSEDTAQEKGAWIITLYKAAGIAAACLLCVMMMGGMLRGGATEYVVPLDPKQEIVVTWRQNQYRSLGVEEIIGEYALPEKASEEMAGQKVAYLRVSGPNQYSEVEYTTAIEWYVCDEKQGVYILHDREYWIYMILAEE